jgi:hypothetical protein
MKRDTFNSSINLVIIIKKKKVKLNSCTSNQYNSIAKNNVKHFL